MKYKKKKKKKGFTLIELLAVIIILGVLMIIAIPSVTEYIGDSRRKAYITTAGQYIGGARTLVNSAKIPMFDTDATYYLPAKCISLEKGGDSPFGELEEAYVVITYDGKGYNYYWTSRDSENMGILLTSENLLNENKVLPGITNLSTNVVIGEKSKIFLINNCSENDILEKEIIDGIAENGSLEIDTLNLFDVITSDAFFDNISSSYVSSSTGINFGVAASNTNGKGVYIRKGTENDRYPVYYYRGAVTNNNVLFADMCWKIVRTTNTGGIKLIYNGVSNGGKCNNTGAASALSDSPFNESYDDNAYVGYMYGDVGANSYELTHSNKNNSTIKSKIDEWYRVNIDEKGFTSKLEDTVWCNDRSFSDTNTGTGYGISNTRYAVNGRVTGGNPQPTFECKNENDRFTVNSSNGNGALIYPVALLTADEATLAGNGFTGYSKYTYLFSGAPGSWLLTPVSFSNGYSFMSVFYTNQLGFSYNNSFSIRPAISLQHWTKITKTGDGTDNNPYIVK